MNLLGPAIPFGLLFSCFPAVVLTIIVMFFYMIVIYVPLAKARKSILRSTDRTHWTEEAIETELARRYPRLYNVRIYSVLAFLLLPIVFYIISFVVIVLIGGSITINW
jgi:hypothetical protein